MLAAISISFLPIIAFLGDLLVRLTLVAFILTRRRSRPVSNLAWITVILAVPLLGAIGFLLVGAPRLGRRRRRRHAEIKAHLGSAIAVRPDRAWVRRPEIIPEHQPLAHLAETVGAGPPLAGNQITLIGDADRYIESLVADIDAAHEYCHLLFYIFMDDHSGRRVAEALLRAAERGVTCRVLVDAVGSRPFTGAELRARMERAGVRVVAALPTNAVRALFARLDLRNHRKLVIIDGSIGYVGSQNVADAAFALKPKYAPWVDASTRILGPVVRDLHHLFAEDWFMDTGETIDDLDAPPPPADQEGMPAQIMGTGPNTYNEALPQLFLTALHTAREEVILTTPYFIPDEATAIALGTAARRGVKTTLVVPARIDSPLVAAASHSYFEPLLEAGVHIYQFGKGLLHAKTLTLDRSLAMMMTANLDRRSFELNFEASMVVYDTDFASQLRFLQQSYVDDSARVTAREWNARPWTTRLLQNAAGTLGPLL